MVKKLKSAVFALTLAVLPGTVLAGGPEMWPYGQLYEPPTVVVIAAGGLPLGIFFDR